MDGSNGVRARPSETEAAEVYEAGLKLVALRTQFITLMVMFGTIAMTGDLYVVFPRASFPSRHRDDLASSPRRRRIFPSRPCGNHSRAMQNAICASGRIEPVGQQWVPAGV